MTLSKNHPKEITNHLAWPTTACTLICQNLQTVMTNKFIEIVLPKTNHPTTQRSLLEITIIEKSPHRESPFSPP